MTYPHIDAIVLIRHQHQFIGGLDNRLPLDQREHFLDYGTPDAFPPHAIIDNPAGRPLPEPWRKAIGAITLAELQLFAEYQPSDLVIWTNIENWL